MFVWVLAVLIMISLRATDVITWEWWIVLIPFWVPMVIACVITLLLMVGSNFLGLRRGR
jgi:hypothetical protein